MTVAVARWTREQVAERVARSFAEGMVVNLGIGMPTLVADYVTVDRGVIFHSENGVLGVGPTPAPGEADPELINASKDVITVLPGASFFHQADSFALIRGGHIDIAVMGAFQVSAHGDLANWSTGDHRIPAVGGAMDLAAGAKSVVAMLTHTTSDLEPKLVERCTLPLTGYGVVTRVYTDLMVADVNDGIFVVRDMAPGTTLESLQAVTAAPLELALDED